MKNVIRFMGVLVILACFFACQSLRGDRPDLPGDTSLPSMIPYQLKAMEYEEKEELQLALANWRIAEALMTERISALTEHIGHNAEKHFQKGLTLFNAHMPEQARLEFLKTLRYDSKHKEALRYLKIDLNPQRTFEYIVKADDTFKTIATQVYNNSNQDSLVAYFSGCADENELVQGRVLTLPVLEVEFTKRFFYFQKEIGQARKYFKDKEYSRVLPMAENILKHQPGNEEAMFMINSSYDGLAEKLVNNQQYTEAIDTLKKVDPKFRNMKNRIMEIETIQARRRAADTENKNAAHYQSGQNFFKKAMYIEALKAFERVDRSYADVQDKIIELKTLMKNESEIHYRKGVKFFLNEKLDEAIQEWEKALALDPENTKVQKDIDNASQLLKKINEMN